MTKDMNDHRKWTNYEIQTDPEGYLAVQRRVLEREAQAQQKHKEEADYAIFVRMFCAAGGTPEGARAAYEARKNEQALEAARRAESEARTMTHASTWNAPLLSGPPRVGGYQPPGANGEGQVTARDRPAARSLPSLYVC